MRVDSGELRNETFVQALGASILAASLFKKQIARLSNYLHLCLFKLLNEEKY